MPNFCVAPNCRGKPSQSGLALFRFPRDAGRCKLWIEKCCRADLQDKASEDLHKHYRLCARHFEASVICKENPNWTVLKDDAVPTIFDARAQQNSSENTPRKRVKDVTEEELEKVKERKLEIPLEQNEKESEIHESQDNSGLGDVDKSEKESKDRLKSLFETLIVAGKQNIPLMGHGKEENQGQGLTPGNFQALLEYRINAGDEALGRKREATYTDMYCSPAELQRLLDVCEICVREELLKEIRPGKFFSILTEKLVDIDGHFHLPIFVRYVDQSAVWELFLGFMPFEGDEDTLTKRMLSEIEERWGLRMEHCRGQAHVCCGVSASKIKAIAACIQQRHPLAVLTPSSTCSLNIYLADSLNLSSVQVVMSTLRKVETFFSSPALQAELEHAVNIFYQGNKEKADSLKEACALLLLVVSGWWGEGGLNPEPIPKGLQAQVMTNPEWTTNPSLVVCAFRQAHRQYMQQFGNDCGNFGEPEHLERYRDKMQTPYMLPLYGSDTTILCVSCTSWMQRHDAFELSVDLLESLLLCVYSIHDNEDSRWSDKVVNEAYVISQVLSDFEFVATLVVLKNSLSFTRAFGKNLQGSTMDVFFAASSLTAVLHSLKEVVDNVEVYHEFWFEEAVDLATAVEIPVKVPRLYYRKQRPETGVEMLPERYYKDFLTVPVVEHLLKELKDIFSENHMKALKSLSLIPAVMAQLKFCTPEENNTNVYQGDLPEADTLPAELHCWKIKWKHQAKDTSLPDSMSQVLELSDAKFFPNVSAFLRVLSLLPVLRLESEECKTTRRRFTAYLEDMPAEHRSKCLAFLRINCDIKHDLDIMIEKYNEVSPEKEIETI